MDPDAPLHYLEALKELMNYPDVPGNVTKTFKHFADVFFQVELENKFAKPTAWSGLLIVAVSLVCIFLLAADLLHGLRNIKLWFPCKYFTMHSHILSLISAAILLPMDSTTAMPGLVDKATKIGSLAFLCSMLANLLPSLATINSTESFRNIMGLGTMLIALVVKVIIQIDSGVLAYIGLDHYLQVAQEVFPNKGYDQIKRLPYKFHFNKLAAVYLVFILVLFILYISSYLENLKTKKMIDAKYQVLHETVSNEPLPDRLTVEKLRQHVSKYGIMAGTGSPQFITVCSVITSACGAICVLSTAIYIHTFVWAIHYVVIEKVEYESDYKWSMFLIFIIQFIGIILGTIAPLCRCFRLLCFKLSVESLKKHKMFKMESYSVQKLYDWKRRSMALPFRGNKCKVITEHVKNFFLKFYIKFEKTVRVACWIIDCIPFFVICSIYCLKCIKDKVKDVVWNEIIDCIPFFVIRSISYLKCIMDKLVVWNEQSSAESENENDDVEDLHRYVLQLEDNTEFSRKTLERFDKCTKRWIKMGERLQPNDLLDLIREYRGVENFDHYQVAPLMSNENPDCWSLPVVTLTTIAISLPRIDKSRVYKLIGSVREGLRYVTPVEQCLSTTNRCLRMQKAAKMLWDEVEVYETWLNNNMQEVASNINTTREILELFKARSQDVVTEMGLDNGSGDDSMSKSICADSMHFITNKILSSTTIDQYEIQQFYEHLTQMISCILLACCTRLPRVIIMKCHTREIEKREATVKAVAKLLGETTEIINALQDDLESSNIV